MCIVIEGPDLKEVKFWTSSKIRTMHSIIIIYNSRGGGGDPGAPLPLYETLIYIWSGVYISGMGYMYVGFIYLEQMTDFEICGTPYAPGVGIQSYSCIGNAHTTCILMYTPIPMANRAELVAYIYACCCRFLQQYNFPTPLSF